MKQREDDRTIRDDGGDRGKKKDSAIRDGDAC